MSVALQALDKHANTSVTNRTARENAASSPKSGSGVQMAQSDAELQLVQSQVCYVFVSASVCVCKCTCLHALVCR